MACPLSEKALPIHLLFPIQKIDNQKSSIVNQSPSTRKTLENKIQSAFENKAEPEFTEKTIETFVQAGILDFTETEHQLLFFKERFLAKDHPDRPKMDRFSAKLRKLGLREETIGYGPTKEKWEAVTGKI